jgi:hypothetical protein
MQLDELFTLIEYGLQELEYEAPLKDEKTWTKVLIENGLVGICYPVIKQGFNEKTYQGILKKAFGAYIYKDTQQSSHMAKISYLFNHAGIDHIYLKGGHLKHLYPKTYMRAMGDIDLIVRISDFEKAIDILKQNDYKLIEAITHHHSFIFEDHMDIELHQSLSSDFDDSRKAFLDTLWDHTTRINQHQYQLTPEFEYTYLLLHLLRHLKQTGIGLRSLIDLDIYKKHYLLDNTRLTEYLSMTDALVFHNRVLEMNDTIFKRIELTDTTKKIINYILKSGIHGKGSDFDYYLPRRVSTQEDKKVSRFKYVMMQVFPPRRHLLETYPYLKKHPYLLPWAWFVRILKLIFKKPKSIKLRLGSLKNDSLTSETKEVFNYFTK